MSTPRRARRAAPLIATAISIVSASALAFASITPASANDTQPANQFSPQAGSPVLISEIAAGGAGKTSQADRNSSKNFIELTNYSAAPVDISGWRIYRCGQVGSGYGPQAIVADGTVLQPGEQYTTAGKKSGYDVDSLYDTDLHSFGYGAFIQNAAGERMDAIGLYHPDISNDCKTASGQWLSRGLQHRLDESHQRVANTGDVEKDWVIAPRTVGAPNRTEWGTQPRINNGLRITEFNSGGLKSTTSQYVEVTNTGTEPVDMSNYQLFRCGDNGSQYLQIGAITPGTVVQPGESWVAARAGGEYADAADMTYSTSMHWRNFGVMLATPDEAIVDSASVYSNRMSSCDNGMPISESLNHFDNTTYVRTSDTGNAADDFTVTPTRTPGTHDPAQPLAPKPTWQGFRDLRISEVAPAGPGGASDEFFELSNYGNSAVNLKGYSVYRCHGTGQPNVGEAQIEDLGDVTLQPGQTYLGVAAGAPADLLAKANGTYSVGLNEKDGYGLYVTDPSGERVDSFASYDDGQEQFHPCQLGEEARNWTKNDEGESYTRAQFLGDNELDFVPTQRTPGVLADAQYVDPTVPLPGELDPVSVETPQRPGTPKVTTDGKIAATIAHADNVLLNVALQAAPRVDAAARVFSGESATGVPTEAPGAAAGEKSVEKNEALTVGAERGKFPYLRFEVPVGDAKNFVWSGKASARNEVQLLSWNASQGRWQVVAADTPSADGDVTLTVEVRESSVTGEGDARVANLMVIDGPRTVGGLHTEIGVTDQAFPNPANYDVAVNHMSDTQFLAEGFRDVFRKQASWVVANADARKIGFNSLTGDIIENWMNGNHGVERANREYAAAAAIMNLVTDAGIPNGVLPGNHDNMWGHNNDKFNEFFPSSMFEGHAWYGGPWKEGDNSANLAYFDAAGEEFLVISLPYRPTTAMMTWAREQAAAHPDHNVILATHSYLYTSGERDSIARRYTGNADQMWEQVVAPSDNIFLVFGGHYHGVSTYAADPITGERVVATPVNGETTIFENVGANGRTVIEMLADYQGYRSTQVPGNPNVTRADLLDRDTGFQRLLMFDVDAGLMAVNAYSPHLDSFAAWKYDEPLYRGEAARYKLDDDEFVVPVSIKRAASLESVGWALTGELRDLATVEGAAAGASVELAVADAVAEGELTLVTVTDEHGNTVRTALGLGGNVADEEETDSTTGDIPVDAVIPGIGDGSGGSGGEGGDGEGTSPEGPLEGVLALSVADGGLSLGDARNRGNHLALSGVLPQVSVTDSRAEAAGWTLTGIAADLLADASTIRSSHLGWEPFKVSGPAASGSQVLSALLGGQGLAVPSVLGSAAADAGVGTSVLSADVSLAVPVDTKADTYRGGITLSLFAQD